MSRCFPFPPPGYERKHRPEDSDLLKEAKSKERKHKKDKERKKDKEKREKDGGAESHRDKKDRKEKRKDKKEKRRDKKEKKDRGTKDKEKSSISEESSVARNSEISETKLSLIGNSKDRDNFPNEGKYEPLLQSSLRPSQGSEESKFVLELDRRIRDEKSSGSQLPERVDKKDQGFILNSSEDNKNEKVDKKMDRQGLENEMVKNPMPIVESKGEGIPRPLNEENGKRLENKDMYNETVGVRKGDKRKEKSKESHGKEKNKEKEYLKTGSKKSEQEKLKDDDRNNLDEFAGNRSTDMSKGVSTIYVNDGSFKKRKDMGTNGFFHESEIRPNKMQRPTPHQLSENGMKHETFRTPAKPSNGEHAVLNRVQVDKKDPLINGMIEARKPSLSKSNHLTADTMVFGQITEASKLPQHDSNDIKKSATVLNMAGPVAEASRRSPHPDSKYLAEVLTVPKNMDWSEYDDQDWLFSEKVPSKSMPTSGSHMVDVSVWSKAIRIESVDVCALPYVIPY